MGDEDYVKRGEFARLDKRVSRLDIRYSRLEVRTELVNQIMNGTLDAE